MTYGCQSASKKYKILFACCHRVDIRLSLIYIKKRWTTAEKIG
ncbi:MAG: hypothetical protein OJF59_001868 [Cytophagales bacterium]|nr:MAG: hypothetical protein OJF59_001868 [Cytophagales bacterium]